MAKLEKTVARRGRKPGDGVGSSAGQKSLARLRYEIHSALGLLEDDGTPLALIIKQQLQGPKPEAMLGVLARMLPSDITLNAGSDFVRSLEQVGAAIDQHQIDRLSALQPEKDIDKTIN